MSDSWDGPTPVENPERERLLEGIGPALHAIATPAEAERVRAWFRHETRFAHHLSDLSIEVRALHGERLLIWYASGVPIVHLRYLEIGGESDSLTEVSAEVVLRRASRSAQSCADMFQMLCLGTTKMSALHAAADADVALADARAHLRPPFDSDDGMHFFALHDGLITHYVLGPGAAHLRPLQSWGAAQVML
jgi:hypothetical protein